MMASITFKVDGLSELGRRMATLKSDVALKMAPRATGKAAALVKKAAKQNLESNNSLNNTAVDTGQLLRAVIVKKIRQTELTAEHVVTVKRVNYPDGKSNTRQVGVYLERGTVNMPAEPFLGPALSKNIWPAINAIKDSLAADLAKAGA